MTRFFACDGQYAQRLHKPLFFNEFWAGSVGSLYAGGGQQDKTVQKGAGVLIII